MIADFKNKVIITRTGAPTQTATGGLIPGAATDTITKWAQVENRSGSVQTDSAQREWNYDYKITLRFTKSFIERSNDTVTFEGKTLLIRSVSFEDEGAKRLVVLRCSNNE